MDNPSASEKSYQLERRLKRRITENRIFKQKKPENASMVEKEKNHGKKMLGPVDCVNILCDNHGDSGYKKSDFDGIKNSVNDLFYDDGKEMLGLVHCGNILCDTCGHSGYKNSDFDGIGNSVNDAFSDDGKEMLGPVECVKIDCNIHGNSGYKSSDFDRIGNYVNDVFSDDGKDPHYEMFLKNLTVTGNSYALVVYPKNSGPEVLNYDIVDRLPDELTLETPKAIECRPGNSKNNKGTRTSRELDSLHGMADFSSEEVVWSARSLRCQLRNEKKGILKPSDDVPVKRIKSGTVARKACGVASGRSRRRSSGSAGSHFIVEEGDTMEDDNDIGLVNRADSGLEVRKASNGANGRSRRRSNANGDGFVYQETESCEDYVRFLNLRCEDVNDDGVEEYLRLLNGGSDRPDVPADAEPGSDGNQTYELDRDETDGVDFEYMEYLDLLMEGEDVMYKIDDSPRRFDEVEESETDSDIIVTDKDPYAGENSTPFVSSQPSHVDLDKYSMAEDFSMASHAQFKKELIEILKRPYDSKQHDDYMQEVKRHKPVNEERQLRSKVKTFPSKTKFAKSYLDLYPDFAKLIDLAKYDKRKSLNLLRGFFYWLKNLSRVGVFQPWLDPSILEVLPH